MPRVDGDDGMGFFWWRSMAMEEGLKLAEKTGIAMWMYPEHPFRDVGSVWRSRLWLKWGQLVWCIQIPARPLPVCGGRTAFLDPRPLRRRTWGFESPDYLGWIWR